MWLGLRPLGPLLSWLAMHAMLLSDFGKPEDLRWTEGPDLTPGCGQVVIDVQAVGCNLADTLIVQGKYQVKPPFPFAPGMEASGRVLSVGEGVQGLKEGQRVLTTPRFGAYATQICADQSDVFPIDDAMPFDEAAAFPIVYQTSYFALVYRAPLLPRQTLLVHGAAGGVGLSAVQIGKALGARVLATAGSESKRQFVREQGADAVFDSRDPGWVDWVKSETDGRGADHIYDPVGGDVFDMSLKCIAFSGNLHVIGFASGRIPEAAMNRVLLKNISLVGLHWGAYRDHEPEKIAEGMAASMEMYGRGQLAVQIGGRYPLQEAARALSDISARRAQGKIVLIR